MTAEIDKRQLSHTDHLINHATEDIDRLALHSKLDEMLNCGCDDFTKHSYKINMSLTIQPYYEEG